MTTVIAKNPGAVNVGIEELGIIVKAGEQRDLTELFSLDEVTSATDLKTAVTAGQIVINDGSSDLSISDALLHLDALTEYEGKTVISVDKNIDGGRADSIYLPSQNYDGGGA